MRAGTLVVRGRRLLIQRRDQAHAPPSRMCFDLVLTIQCVVGTREVMPRLVIIFSIVEAMYRRHRWYGTSTYYEERSGRTLSHIENKRQYKEGMLQLLKHTIDACREHIKSSCVKGTVSRKITGVQSGTYQSIGLPLSFYRKRFHRFSFSRHLVFYIKLLSVI